MPTVMNEFEIARAGDTAKWEGDITVRWNMNKPGATEWVRYASFQGPGGTCTWTFRFGSQRAAQVALASWCVLHFAKSGCEADEYTAGGWLVMDPGALCAPRGILSRPVFEHTAKEADERTNASAIKRAAEDARDRIANSWQELPEREVKLTTANDKAGPFFSTDFVTWSNQQKVRDFANSQMGMGYFSGISLDKAQAAARTAHWITEPQESSNLGAWVRGLRYGASNSWISFDTRHMADQASAYHCALNLLNVDGTSYDFEGWSKSKPHHSCLRVERRPIRERDIYGRPRKPTDAFGRVRIQEGPSADFPNGREIHSRDEHGQGGIIFGDKRVKHGEQVTIGGKPFTAGSETVPVSIARIDGYTFCDHFTAYWLTGIKSNLLFRMAKKADRDNVRKINGVPHVNLYNAICALKDDEKRHEKERGRIEATGSLLAGPRDASTMRTFIEHLQSLGFDVVPKRS